MSETERFDDHPLFRGSPQAILGSAVLVMLPLTAALIAAAITGVDALGLPGVVATWLAAAYALRRHGLSWAALGLSRRYVRRGLAAAVPVTLLLLALGVAANVLLERLLGWTPDLSAFEVLEGDRGALASMLVIAWTSAAFGEEMIFRAFLMRALRDADPRLRWAPAVLLSSLLFGCAHSYQDAAGVLMTGLIGLVLAVAYLRTGRNLWTAVFAHGLYDTVGLVMVHLGGSSV